VVFLSLVVPAAFLASWAQFYLDGRLWLWTLFEKLRIARRSLEAWDLACCTGGQHSDVIVSLTTIPERVECLQPTLKSLLAQSRKPSKIVLWLPTVGRRSGQEYQIPPWLHALRSVEIRRCDDMGPATKFLYALREFPGSTRILVVDDDKIYPRKFIEQIEKYSTSYPEYALGYSGWRIPRDLTDRPTTFWRNLRRIPPAPVKSPWVKCLYRVDILQGYSGYLIKPDFFDLDSIWDYSKAPLAAFFVDDVWISAHCKAQKYVIPVRRFCMEPTGNRRLYSLTSLGLLNRGNGNPNSRNNTIMMRYFENSWGTRGR